MKNKKIFIIITTIVVLAILSFLVYYIFTKEDKNTTLTIIEKQWIENSKNKVIDLSILNQIPLINYSGEGVFFDFIEDLEEATKLEFNKVSYNLGSNPKTEYALRLVDKAAENDILVYQDNYVILTKDKKRYNKLEEISGITLGVLNEDLESINNYLLGSNIAYKTFNNVAELISANEVEFNTEDNADNSNYLDGIILLKTTYLDKIIENDKLHISYNITEYTKDYVLTLGQTDKLNNIMRKYFKKWYSDNYTKSYNTHFSSNYFSFKGIDEKEVVKFRSKRYAYGFVLNTPYDALDNGRLLGLNNAFMTHFSTIANVEISYQKFDNISKLLTNFNENKLDFYFNNSSINDYEMDVYQTINLYENEAVVLSHLDTELLVNSINSLRGKKILAVKDTKVAKYLTDNNIELVLYDNVDKLITSAKKADIIVIDSQNYDYYSKNKLKKYTKDYEFTLTEDYNYVVRDIKDNKVFSEFFDFYLSFFSTKSIMNIGYNQVYSITTSNIFVQVLLIAVPILIIVVALFMFASRIKNKDTSTNKKKTTLTKEDKLKYIDMLTSLKNRNYLNDNIEVWDNSDIYPQTIIIIDLNNVAYVNDNYGHQEGDALISEAANVLITNQISNSEIIRTNGNEFLIYLVGYDEKQIVSYIRKLNKEFKGISHGFGAAIGYSMINDAIKTIDDAVNEATLDMRNNKEEINN